MQQLEPEQQQAEPPALTNVFDLVAAILRDERKNTLAAIATLVAISGAMARHLPAEDREWLAQQFFKEAQAVNSSLH
jgi:hypothetical protein